MKKTRPYILLLLVLVCALLFACCTMRPETAPEASASPETSATPAASAEASATPDATATPTVKPSATATATPGPLVYTNPLTGEATDKDYSAQRPVAVMIENNRTSDGAPITQFGIGEADILYEIEVEKITRCMALFTDVSDVAQICPIRSARTYFVGTAMAYDAIYVHEGYSAEGLDWAINMLGQYYTDNDDVNLGDSNSYRLSTWPHTGEHSLCTSGKLLTDFFASAGTRTEHKNGAYDYGLQFADGDALTSGDAGNTVRLVFPEYKLTNFTYSADKGGYTSDQWGTGYVDGNTNELAVFENVLVLLAPTQVGIDTKWHSAVTLTDYTGTGYFCNNGYCVPINWSRAGLDDTFHYTNADGTPLKLGVGRTYIGLTGTELGGVTFG